MRVLVCTLGSCLGEIYKWLPFLEGEEKLKREGGCPRLVGGRFNKQRNLYMRLVLGGHKQSRSLYPPTRLLKGYKGSLMGFSHIYHSRWPQQHLALSRVCPWNSSHCINGGQNVYSKDRGGIEGPSVVWIQLIGEWWVTSSQWPLPTEGQSEG